MNKYVNKYVRKGIELDNGNVVVDGVEYKTVERKAEKGDLIYINNSSLSFGRYKKGDVLTVHALSNQFPAVFAVGIKPPYIRHDEYVVLEPVVASETNETNNDILLERITNVINELIEIEYELASAKVGRSMSKIAKTVEKQSRQEIIDKAKADVEQLKERAYTKMDTPSTGLHGHLIPEFIVNKEKRTVVCLLRLRYISGVLAEKGIAKCAPNDCFNVHIGKAIALRRALGLDVPKAYLNAPQPTRAEVGDVVIIGEDRFKIIDDSRD